MTGTPRNEVAPAAERVPLAGPLLYALALRFLRGRGSRLLSSTALAALAASTLGVTAMGVAMALMTGYQGDLQKKLVGANAAVMVYPPLELERSTRGARLAEAIGRLPEITRVDRVAYVQIVHHVAAVCDELQRQVVGETSGHLLQHDRTFAKPLLAETFRRFNQMNLPRHRCFTHCICLSTSS